MGSQSLKEQAALEAIDRVADGMRLGLGTGSTADCFIRLLGERVRAGLRVTGLPTSNRTARLAESLGIVLIDFSEVTELDLAVDGTDEFDPRLHLIKGGGGALLREKIVASAAARFIVICDDAKAVDVLGQFPLPVEVAEFGWQRTAYCLRELGCSVERRSADGGSAFRTAQNNLIIDCLFEAISDPHGLARQLESIPGVLEHGLFVSMADEVIVASPGSVRSVTTAVKTG